MTSSSGHHNTRYTGLNLIFQFCYGPASSSTSTFFVAITSQLSRVYFLSPTAEDVSVCAPFLPSGRVSLAATPQKITFWLKTGCFFSSTYSVWVKVSCIYCRGFKSFLFSSCILWLKIGSQLLCVKASSCKAAFTGNINVLFSCRQAPGVCTVSSSPPC